MTKAKKPPRLRPVVLAALTLPLAACMPGEAASLYTKALPEALETTGHVRWGSDGNWFDMFLPLRPETCGAAVFRLAPETVERIEREGLAFFANARQARAYPAGSPQEHHYSYAAWQATPAPSAWFGDGVVAGSLSCAGFANRFIGRIADQARLQGGYFTTRPQARLIVLPGDGIAILTFFH